MLKFDVRTVDLLSVNLAPDRVVEAALDPALVNLVCAAERNETCPMTYLLAGGWLLQGTPVSSEAFLSESQNQIYHEILNSREARKFRGTAAEKDRVIRAAVTPIVEPLGEIRSGKLSALTLLGASAYPPGASMIHMRVIRVSLQSIASWWINGCTADEPAGSSSADFSAFF